MPPPPPSAPSSCLTYFASHVQQSLANESPDQMTHHGSAGAEWPSLGYLPKTVRPNWQPHAGQPQFASLSHDHLNGISLETFPEASDKAGVLYHYGGQLDLDHLPSANGYQSDAAIVENSYASNASTNTCTGYFGAEGSASNQGKGHNSTTQRCDAFSSENVTNVRNISDSTGSNTFNDQGPSLLGQASFSQVALDGQFCHSNSGRSIAPFSSNSATQPQTAWNHQLGNDSSQYQDIVSFRHYSNQEQSGMSDCFHGPSAMPADGQARYHSVSASSGSMPFVQPPLGYIPPALVVCHWSGCNLTCPTASMVRHWKNIHLPPIKEFSKQQYANQFFCLWNQCHKQVKRPADLDRHVRSVHLREYFTFDCTVAMCGNNEGKGFSRADKLKAHEKNVHGFR